MSGQSTDEENARALPSVANRSDSVRKSSRPLQSIAADQFETTSIEKAVGDAIVSGTRKGKPTAL